MRTLILPVVLVSMSGCSPPSSNAPTSSEPTLAGLENVDWELRQYLGDSGEMTAVLAETTVDARFSEGQIVGSAGCNRYFGPYDAGEDHRLKLASEIGSTQMACAPDVARQEQRYLALLPLVSSWQRSDAALLLLDGDRRSLLEFAAARSVALADSVWQATGINNGRGGVVSAQSTHLSTLSFAENEIRGNAGCNQFSASYEIEGNQITIGRAATTRMHCAEPDGLMEQEQQYLGALARARTYTLARDRLELRDENGSLQVSYRIQEN